ncbi:MAG TPA: cation:proton antiporter [Planctomycetota bacterium]|nr:cation:proton antiporter [Planctomycetota bacterium]
MHEGTGFLRDLAIVLSAAALVGVAFQRLRQPAVLGYLLAGMLVGPHLGLPLVADLDTVAELAELGVIVLLFSIGLEFSVRRLLRLGPSAGVIAAVEVGWMIWLGFLAGQMLGWSTRESVFIGAMLGISSTMIVARVFASQRAPRGLVELVFGILVVEDLIAILMVALLTTMASGQGLSAGATALQFARLGGFLIAMVALGLMFVPRALSMVARLESREATLVASIGLCFAFALLAREFGYSVALGAFIAGMLAAESGEAHRIEVLVRPVRDIFSAVFFVSVGMLVDPRVLIEAWPAVLLLTATVVVGKITGVTLGTLLVGVRTETAVRAGFSLAQIGEFSFVIAGSAVALGPGAARLGAVAVAVCALTAFVAPWLARHGEHAGRLVAQHLPASLRTFLSLYATWLENARQRPPNVTAAARVRRAAAWLLADAAMMVALVVTVGLYQRRLVGALGDWVGVGERPGRWIVVAVTLLAVSPFVLGVLRFARRLGLLLAEQVLPTAEKGLDLAAAPRRALVAGLQLALLLGVGLPTVAIMQPFLPVLPGVGVLLALVLLAFVGLWRSAGNLQGHVRAGTGLILEVLAGQGRTAHEPSLEAVQDLLPGLGRPTPIQLREVHRAVGHSVAEVNLHGRSGVVILCISRGGEGVVAPTGEQVFQVGDVLTVAGTSQAVALARAALEHGTEGD